MRKKKYTPQMILKFIKNYFRPENRNENPKIECFIVHARSM